MEISIYLKSSFNTEGLNEERKAEVAPRINKREREPIEYFYSS